ncbi:nucleotidyltransferase domain-containing protein [Virgibacillus sp. CBA3643]|uniref:nucleotidyltransferase domain-containing protein n=1 Tax=Virgibacillus sp. CBA3643 TaxID=2942278 RepID=UPI0035A3686C
MASIPSKVVESVSQFVSEVSLEIPVKKAILFGSFAKGTYDEGSDIDLAIFSDYFESVSRVEGTTYLLIQAQSFEMDLEPIAFTWKEYDDRLGIVDEILETGIDVQEITGEIGDRGV